LGAVAVGVPSAAHAAPPTAARAPRPATAAATTATNGLIAYSCFNHGGSGKNGWVVATSTGANKVFTAWTRGPFGGSAQWSADGTELVHSAAMSPTDPATGKPARLSIVLSEADGSYPWQLTTDDPAADTADVDPAWLSGGAVFTRQLGAGATDVREALNFGVANPPEFVSHAEMPDGSSVTGDLAWVHDSSDITVNGVFPLTSSGVHPRFSPDASSVAYVDAATRKSIHTISATGTNDTVAVTTPTGPITDLAWSPDQTKWLIAGPTSVWVEDRATGKFTLIGGYECNGGSPQVSWQPIPSTPERVVRIAGSDRVGTSIAVSKASFPTDHTADAVVLADSMHFPDALAGTPLAVKEHAPLLLTDGSKQTIDPRVMAEIRRVIKSTSSPVYVLGGTSSVSGGIETALNSAGYTALKRFAGSDRYDTALQIAQFMQAGNPALNIFLATGTDFPDGLSAGAAAAAGWPGFPTQSDGAVLLLTNGAQLPPAVKHFIDVGKAAPSPASVIAVGGLAARAYPTADYSAVGADRYQTSELLAEKWFSPTTSVELATGLSFPDALTGGTYEAALGHGYIPLLLVPPSLSGSGAVPSVLHAWSAAIDHATVFGGTGVVSSTEVGQLRSIIGLKTTCTVDTDTAPPAAC
jgi:hypothetical protein